MESAIWGLIGTAIGAAASLLTTFITNRHSEVMSVKARSEERLQRFRDFQRETLLELQTALNEVARTTFLVHLEDTKSYVSSQEWGTGQVPPKLDEECLVARTRVMIFAERVADEAVRKTVKALMEEVGLFISTQSKLEADSSLNKIISLSRASIEMAGKTLRDLY